MKLKKGDQVIVILGKDKGKKGKIEKVFPKTHAIVVAGVNVYKKHKKKRDEAHPAGIVEVIKPIAASKVMLVCPKCEKMTRVGYSLLKDEKTRVCKKCQQPI